MVSNASRQRCIVDSMPGPAGKLSPTRLGRSTRPWQPTVCEGHPAYFQHCLPVPSQGCLCETPLHLDTCTPTGALQHVHSNTCIHSPASPAAMNPSHSTRAKEHRPHSCWTSSTPHPCMGSHEAWTPAAVAPCVQVGRGAQWENGRRVPARGWGQLCAEPSLNTAKAALSRTGPSADRWCCPPVRSDVSPAKPSGQHAAPTFRPGPQVT